MRNLIQKTSVLFAMTAIIGLCADVPGIGVAFADDFYVDAVNGNDDTGDGSEGNPWKKLQYAIDTIEGTETNPHTIHLAPGIYGPGGSGDITASFLNSYENIIGEDLNKTFVRNICAGSVVHGMTISNSDITNISTKSITVNNHSTGIVIRNCKLSFNASLFSFHISNYSSCEMHNSTVYKCKESIYVHSGSSVIVRNCIFFDNIEDFDVDEESDLAVTYSNIEEGYPGTGNISSDPLFVDPDRSDFRLRYDSPCIDAGDPSDDVPPGGGSRIDMGCHEYQFEPVLTITDMTWDESPGDDDGIPELDETILMNPLLENSGESSSGITASLLCSHPDVTVGTAVIQYPALASDESSYATGAFEWTVTGESGYCMPVDFQVSWVSAEGSGELDIPLSLHGNEAHVDPEIGSDETGTGAPGNPYKTLNHTIKAINGNRWMPLTVRAHTGTYSPSSNNEIYPLYFGDYESIQGDGMEVTLLDNDSDENQMIFTGPHTSLYDMHVRSDQDCSAYLIRTDFTDGEMVRCHIEKNLNNTYYMGFLVRGESNFSCTDNIVEAFSVMGSYFENNHFVLENNYLYKHHQYNGEIIGNHIGNAGEGGLYFRSMDEQPPLIIKDNLIEGYEYSISGEYFHFTDNILKVGWPFEDVDSRSTVVRNVIICEQAAIAIYESPEPFIVGQNVLVGEGNVKSGFAVSSSAAYYINNVTVPLRPENSIHPTFDSLWGAYSLDGCVGLFAGNENAWGATAWSNHSVFYHGGEADDCERAYYNDLNGCPMETNLDADPMFVGTGYISEVGVGYFKDDTSAWEPDRYKGLYVNPAILTCDTPFYCWGNSADTIYVDGDPSAVASIGDLYFIPDFRLRRYEDGFAFDSPLIDAGNPDPEWNDPDGSRCDIGPHGGPYSLTPMPVIPTWPAPGPSPTPSPLPTMTSTPTVTQPPTYTPTPIPSATAIPSATPAEYRYNLILNAGYYSGGDLFYFHRVAWNPSASREVFEMIVLDVFGAYFYWPEWSEDISGDLKVIPSGESDMLILDFEWPSGECGQASGVWFWGCFFDPVTSAIIGNYDGVEFGWGA